MESREIVRRAIEFKKPPRLPFFQHQMPDLPDDVCDIWEMDRQKNGWFFDNVANDDWGCVWAVTEMKNMGQVTYHPLEDWSKLDTYKPPNPRDPFYFERIEGLMADARDRYVVVTTHFNLIDRIHLLRGFNRTLEDFYLEPEKSARLLDIIMDFKLEQLDELHHRFGDRVHGIFWTDDWGTQERTFISTKLFEELYAKRYQQVVRTVHGFGWHFILHSCGKVNAFLPYWIDAGVDMMNMGQPRAYGIKEISKFAGKIAFLATADIQTTLPAGDPEAIRREVRELVESWTTPDGGMVVFNYGDPAGIGVKPEMAEIMFRAFEKESRRWAKSPG